MAYDKTAMTAAAAVAAAALCENPVQAAVTNAVDVAALVAAVDAGLSETNGWTLSGLGKYAAGNAWSGNPACVKFDTLGDVLESPDFGARIVGIGIGVRCSATDNATRLLHIRDMDGNDMGVVSTCARGDRYESQSLSFGDVDAFSRFRNVLDGTKTTGNWGLGAISVITAEPAAAPANLRVSRRGDNWCSLAWENGGGTVSNRVDTFLVERGAGETALLDTGFDSFDAGDKKNPVQSADKLPEIDPALSGVNIYAPTNTSGICQIGTGRELGFLRYDGIDDYSNVVLRLRAKRYPGDNAETTIISVDSAGATNEVETIVLGSDYAAYEIGLSSVTNAGSALLLGYYTTKSNRRVLLDGLSIVRLSTDRETRLDSRWIPASPGAGAFSTKGSLALPAKAECRFEVRAMNADGTVSDAAAAEARLGGDPGFRFILQ